MAVVIARDAYEQGRWRRPVEIVISQWTGGLLDDVRDALARLDATIALGEKRAPNGDVMLVLGVTHVTPGCLAILRRAPRGLVDLQALLTPLD